MRITQPKLSAAAIAALLVLASCSEVPGLAVITAGGDGPPTLLLLHGFGSSANEWMPFTRTIQWPRPGRFVFPQGPETLESSKGRVARAWWPLELHPFTSPPESLPDLSRTRPTGLKPAADAVVLLLQNLDGPLVLGGFSQGAMLASEVAYRSNVPLAGLVLLSGTPVDEQAWKSAYGGRRGLPVFVAHGRADSVLPFSGSDRMRRDLAAAGNRVTWHPFDGDHEIPADVVIALNQFLRELRQTF